MTRTFSEDDVRRDRRGRFSEFLNGIPKGASMKSAGGVVVTAERDGQFTIRNREGKKSRVDKKMAVKALDALAGRSSDNAVARWQRNRSPAPASSLNRGDIIDTSAGPATVVSVEPSKKQDSVRIMLKTAKGSTQIDVPRSQRIPRYESESVAAVEVTVRPPLVDVPMEYRRVRRHLRRMEPGDRVRFSSGHEVTRHDARSFVVWPPGKTPRVVNNASAAARLIAPEEDVEDGTTPRRPTNKRVTVEGDQMKVKLTGRQKEVMQRHVDRWAVGGSSGSTAMPNPEQQARIVMIESLLAGSPVKAENYPALQDAVVHLMNRVPTSDRNQVRRLSDDVKNAIANEQPSDREAVFTTARVNDLVWARKGNNKAQLMTFTSYSPQTGVIYLRGASDRVAKPYKSDEMTALRFPRQTDLPLSSYQWSQVETQAAFRERAAKVYEDYTNGREPQLPGGDDQARVNSSAIRDAQQRILNELNINAARVWSSRDRYSTERSWDHPQPIARDGIALLIHPSFFTRSRNEQRKLIEAAPPPSMSNSAVQELAAIPNPERRAAQTDIAGTMNGIEVGGLRTVVTRADTASIAGVVVDAAGTKVGEFSRRLSYNADGKGTEVYHSFFSINPEHRSGGLGEKFIQQSFDAYRRHGFTGVRVGANVTVGGYMWAKMGFDLTENTGMDDERRAANMRRTWAYRAGMRPAEVGISVEVWRELRDELEAGKIKSMSELALWGKDRYSSTREVDGKDMTVWPGKLFLIGSSWGGWFAL